MNEKKLTVRMIEGETPEDCNIIRGGYDPAPDWEEYVEEIVPEWKEYVEILKQYILKKNLLGMTGEMQRDMYFLFSDGVSLAFTFRAFADLMQAIVNKREGYCKYYM